MEIRHFTWPYRNKRYETAKVRAGSHEIEITESPTGRSVHVHIDGKRVGP